MAETSEAAQHLRLRDTIDARRADLDVLYATVQQYLARNARRFVGLDKLFSFMRM